MRFVPLAIALLFFATPASAAPLAGVISLVGSAFTAISGSAIGSFLLRTATSFALNALANALIGKQKTAKTGIGTDSTMAGGTLSQTVVFGRYATAGTAVCPPMTHGRRGSDTVDYLTYVIDVADFPIEAIRAVFVGDTRCVFTTPGNLYGETSTSNEYTGNAWMRWHDGRQTESDPMLVEVYGGYERPWTTDHLLTGTAYAALTFKYRDGETDGMPEVLFELEGARLYDPRNDSTVGGSGAQRFDDQSTHRFTTNPVVMIYNLMRGLRLADGSIYGLRVPAEELPLDRWVAAMNVCDEVVEVFGEFEKRYTAGLEFSLETEPLDVIQTLLTACSGQIADCGGAWNITVGPAAFPRAHFTDSDCINGEREFQPFRGLAETYNGAHASYPNPDVKWQAKDAPPFYNAVWEEEDDSRRLTATLNLNAVINGYQAQRLMIEMVSDNRRWVGHTLTLRPGALGLLPLDTVSWTSARNGYVSKLFEITRKVVDPETLCVTLQLRERSPSDYEYDYEALLQPVVNPVGPWNPEDGNGDTPEGDYDLDPERPDPLGVHLLALHSGAVSESTDGGYSWVRAAAPWSGGVELSALRESMVVRTGDGSAWFAKKNAPNAWKKLDFEDPAAVDLLENGGFEDGLDNWETAFGFPAVSDATTPEQRDGVQYVRLSGEAQLRQTVVIPDGAPDLTLEADFWVSSGEARVGIGRLEETFNVALEERFYTWTTPVWYNLRDGLRLRFQILERSGYGSDAFQFHGVSRLFYAGWLRIRVTLVDANDAEVPLSFSLTFSGLGGGERMGVERSDRVDLQPGSSISSTTLGGGDYVLNGVGHVGRTDAGRFSVFATGSVDLLPQLPVTAGSIEDISYEVYMERARVYGIQTIAPIDSGKTGRTAGWKRVRVNVPGATVGEAIVFVESDGGNALVYADNVRLRYSEPGAETIRVLATDTRGRCHWAVSETALFRVSTGGDVEAIGPSPIAGANALAADGQTLVVSDGAEMSVSSDTGETFGPPVPVAAQQVFARPPLGITPGGDVCGADGSVLQSLGMERWLERDAWAGGWFAVEAVTSDYATTLLGALGSMEPGPSMPIGGGQNPRVVAANLGRKFGWMWGRKDLVWLDDGAEDWRLAFPLEYTVEDLREVR